MLFSLINFQDHFPKTIVDKGKMYYKDGNVTDITERSEELYEATVEGEEEYTVTVELENSHDVKRINCTCPYDYGDYCKHMAATLLSLCTEKEIANPLLSTTAKKMPKTKENNLDFLKNLSADELRQAVLDLTKEVKEAKNWLLIRFSEKALGDSENFYPELIQKMAKSASDRSGFIDYHKAKMFTKPVFNLLQKAETSVANGLYRIGFDISAAIIVEVHKVIRDMDDSEGDAEELISGGLNLLLNIIVKHKAPRDLQEIIFSFVHTESQNETYDYCGFDDAFLALLMESAILVQKTDEALAVIDKKLLEAAKPKKRYVLGGDSNDYETEKLLETKIQFLNKLNRKDEATAIITNHLHINTFLQAYIEQLIHEGDFSSALTHIEKDKIPKKEAHFNSYNPYWDEKLIQIARLQNSKEDEIKVTLALLKGTGYRLAYWKRYKTLCNTNDWIETRTPLIAELTEKNLHLHQFDVLVQIYQYEEMWAELLVLLKRTTNMECIIEYAKPLEIMFPTDVISIYEKGLISYAEIENNRSAYKQLVKYLKKTQQLVGGKEKVKELVGIFKTSYKHRPAMIQELNKLIV
jgi:hypothetical protein